MLQPLPPPAEGDVSLPYEMSNIRNYALAVSGDVFRWIIDYGGEEVLKRVNRPILVMRLRRAE